MTILESSYNRQRLPEVELQYDTDSGFYTATVIVIESEPERSVSTSEQLRGISSLSPITVSSNSKQALIDIAIEATALAIDATPGESVDPKMYIAISYAVSASIRGAMEGLGQ